RSKNCRRQVIPQIGDSHQPPRIAFRHNREIAEVDLLSSHQFKNEFVDQIGEAEGKVFRTFSALCHYTEVRPVPNALQKTSDHLRCIFTISIHNEDGIAVIVFDRYTQANRDGPLMADIDRQVNDLRALQIFQTVEVAKPTLSDLCGAVVNGAHHQTYRKI